MITNAEIYKLAASKLTVQGVEIPCINGVLGFSDAIIALARQVKPLEFKPDEKSDHRYDLIAYTSYGHYGMSFCGLDGQLYLYIDGVKVPDGFSSEHYAVIIADDVHKAKILSELGHGRRQ